MQKDANHVCPICKKAYKYEHLNPNITIMKLVAKLERIYQQYRAGGGQVMDPQ